MRWELRIKLKCRNEDRGKVFFLPNSIQNSFDSCFAFEIFFHSASKAIRKIFYNLLVLFCSTRAFKNPDLKRLKNSRTSTYDSAMLAVWLTQLTLERATDGRRTLLEALVTCFIKQLLQHLSQNLVRPIVIYLTCLMFNHQTSGTDHQLAFEIKVQ